MLRSDLGDLPLERSVQGDAVSLAGERVPDGRMTISPIFPDSLSRFQAVYVIPSPVKISK